MIYLKQLFSSIVLSAVLLTVHTSACADDYSEETQIWREQRAARLSSPYGWLSLIGLHWIKEGENTIGSAPDNLIQFTHGPEYIGTVKREKNALNFLPSSAVVLEDGMDLDHAITLQSDAQASPTVLQAGEVRFYPVSRGDLAFRVKHPMAKARQQFSGLDWFPIDPKWRVVADFVPYQPAKLLKLATVIGWEEPSPVPGKLDFEVNGQSYSLDAVQYPGSQYLFLIFADRSNGSTTYGPGRFLDAELPDQNGQVVLDFNRSYNPPCAFTPFSTCSLPPRQNRLNLSINAGEKKYPGPSSDHQ